jgi:hypothetical protein
MFGKNNPMKKLIMSALLPILLVGCGPKSQPEKAQSDLAASQAKVKSVVTEPDTASALKKEPMDGTYSTIDDSGDVLRISRGTDGQLQISLRTWTSAGTWEPPQALRSMPKDNDFLKDREFASAVEAGYVTSDGGGAFFVMKQGASLYGEKVPARYMLFPYVYLKRR